MTNPSLPEALRASLTKELMAARRAVRTAKGQNDPQAEADAHRAVDRVKHALGERGDVWWRDGAPDFNRTMARNTPYASWFASLASLDDRTGSR